MDRYELRREDYSLSADQADLQTAYAKFFATYSTIEVVRAAEATGMDGKLWERLCDTGATTMALPTEVGGDGATLVDLTLVAEEIGRWLAPVPWIDHVSAARLLGRLGALTSDDSRMQDFVTGKAILGFDAHLDRNSGTRLIGAGAVADAVVLREGDEVVLLFLAEKPPRVDNLARLPMAWIEPSAVADRVILGSGPAALSEYQRAADEWRLLTASALVGLVEQTMRIASEFATNRYTFGVAISALQGISHPLANMAISVEGGRALARKAAWFLDYEPDVRPELAGAAFVFMSEEASKAATMAVHVQGGLGVSKEAAGTSYLVRARGWPLAGGDTAATASHVARSVVRRDEPVTALAEAAAV
ncbi:acyl-CoA dehydrogenase family protein [Gordonia sp. LSe1-13]|uniref:Acyl-CoA dehydrogenase family protein n=1 Tax=Gordonia sesuvii TaxID=3116777 RepID=A0ABU7M902_9ACTN|nr:acyl-CoA dehydrogenase family protein [Gordonia sp. LSe1-13]